MNKQEVIKTGDRVITRGVVVRNFEGYGGCQFSEVETDKGAIITCATEHLEPDEPQKVKVSQVAVDYYEQYKDELSGFDEWFSGLYSYEFENDFDKAEELQTWLYDNDDKTNRQREFALATLIVNGLDAVEVEQEKLYTVEIPDPNIDEYSIVLGRKEGKVCIRQSMSKTWKMSCSNQLTEAEIKQDFEWAWQFAKEVE
ncbi:hypothetical protein Javan291_0028 [Streptococcus phage Javan291]|uniref:DUF1642 domain-containing protein n=1 Tax=Streptococcus marmotae TaxID=1825069 RepID=UPI0008319C6B|nr:DUF1642 domain-containing protein [Streptococcus marmotae]QBX16904.1 hypothetical protein Javan291_0028 [Streptococcus phage Javan291]